MVKILGINASPRKYGNTAKLLYVALYAAEKFEAETEILHLYDYDIKPCQACLADDQLACRPPCLPGDDSWNILKKMLESDGVIISTPVFWYGVPGHLKNFIDKMTVFENMIFIEGKSWVEGKVAAFIAVAAESGSIQTISYLMNVFNSFGYIIPPWALAYYHGDDDVLNHKKPIMDALNIGKILVQMIEKVSSEARWYDPKLYDTLARESREYSHRKAMEHSRQKLDRISTFINSLVKTDPSRYRRDEN